MKKYQNLKNLVENSNKITIIQAENPDGDSLGSSLALEGIFSDLGKEVLLFCPVEIPKYLRYFDGWDRVSDNLWPSDLYIIVDTVSAVLLSKITENPLYRNLLEKGRVIAIDHHVSAQPDLDFAADLIVEDRSSTAEIILEICQKFDWKISKDIASNLLGAILSDTLGFSTQNVSSQTFQAAADLTDLGATASQIEEARRELAKKSPEILHYKGELIQRIEYYLDGKLALVHIPWEDIKKYSDKYNPGALVADEMRLVEGVEVCVAIKTYPDGRLTGRIRTNTPIAADIAGYFGGGGHAYAAGFRVYENYDQILRELLIACEKIFNGR